jgi:hypothetical protein
MPIVASGRPTRSRGLKRSAVSRWLDREIGLAGIYPESPAQVPAAGKARIERQRPIDQPDHRTDVLAANCQHEGGIGEDARVVLRRLERLPGKLDDLAATCLTSSHLLVTSRMWQTAAPESAGP